MDQVEPLTTPPAPADPPAPPVETQQLAPLAPPADEVATDVHCRRCGYNLRGLREDGRCPECGLALEVSLYEDLISFSPPRWLRTVRCGAILILCGIIGMMYAAFWSIVANQIAGTTAVVLCMVVGAWLCIACGNWLVTSSDPSGIHEAQLDPYRRASRICVATAAILVSLQTYSILARSAAFSPPLRQALAYASSAAALAAIMGHFIYLHKLLLRIPDKRFTGRALVLMLLGVSAIALALVGDPLMVRVLVPFLGFWPLIWYIAVLARLIRRLKQAAIASDEMGPFLHDPAGNPVR